MTSARLDRYSALLATALLVGCGPDLVTSSPEFEWDSSPQALVASLGTAGGYVPSIIRFSESLYGDDFVLLMGDGRLLWGKPQQVQQRGLDQTEMHELLEQSALENDWSKSRLFRQGGDYFWVACVVVLV